MMPRAHAKENAYVEQLKQQFGEIIDAVALADLQKRFLRGRWLDQMLWFESNARYNQRRYYLLRLVTIVGGVIVPALVSLNVRKDQVAQTLAWVTFGLSLVVAISAALEAFFRYGERWRTFRRTAEALKAQGWQFFELSGPYQGADHASAFPTFAAQVEAVVQQDVEAFIAQAQAQAVQPAVEGHGEAGSPDHP
jgi:Protein of unknown function (DUF4231)